MRKYRTNASAEDRVEYGVELVEGLRYFPETASAAGAFEAHNTDLEAKHRARVETEHGNAGAPPPPRARWRWRF